MAARRSKKDTKKSPTQAASASASKVQDEKPPSTLSQILGLVMQMAMIWVMTTLIMYALKYYGIAQGQGQGEGEEPEN